MATTFGRVGPGRFGRSRRVCLERVWREGEGTIDERESLSSLLSLPRTSPPRALEIVVNMLKPSFSPFAY